MIKYLIWGTGYQANVIWQSNCSKFADWNIEIVGFVDNRISLDRHVFHGIKIYMPSEIADLEWDYIDIWVIDEGLRQIKSQIKNELGIRDEKIRNAFEYAVEKFSEPYIGKNEFLKPSFQLFSACIDYYRSHQWYKQAYKSFDSRKRSYYVYEWIRENVSRDCKILDIACGAGELLWYLREDGFENLYGFDIDDTSICTAKAVDRITHGNIVFFNDDAVSPKFKGRYDLFIWMTGMYLLKDYSLEKFFSEYVPKLYESGYIIFEMVDSSYNDMENNEYFTQDWNSEGEKRHSEYIMRMLKQQVVDRAAKFNLTLKKIYDVQSSIPFKIYIFQKV